MDEAGEWLARARSSLKLASAAEGDAEICLEERCFQLHQAAEKGIKALLIHHGTDEKRFAEDSLVPWTIENTIQAKGLAVRARSIVRIHLEEES